MTAFITLEQQSQAQGQLLVWVLFGSLFWFLIIVAFLLRIGHRLKRLERSVTSLRDSKKEAVGNHGSDQ